MDKPTDIRPIVDDRRFTAEVNLEDMTVMVYRDDKNGKLTYEDLQKMNLIAIDNEIVKSKINDFFGVRSKELFERIESRGVKKND